MLTWRATDPLVRVFDGQPLSPCMNEPMMATSNSSVIPVIRSFVFLVSVAWFHPATSLSAESDNRLPWDGEFFLATPEVVLQGVDELETPSGERDAYLLLDHRTHIDNQHRQRKTSRAVYQIHSREDMQERGSVTAYWTPWIEERPVIRARVITPDGKQHLLDQSTIAESAGNNLQDQMYLDHKVLSAPLPAVCVGAVIETEVITQEHQSFCSSGIIGDLLTERLTTCRRVYTQLSADESIGLRLFSIGEAVPLDIETREGRKTWELDQESPESLKKIWPYLPPEVPLVSRVTYCTGDSWQKVAEFYYNLVDDQIRDASLADVVGHLKSKNVDRREKIRLAFAKKLAKMHRSLTRCGSALITPALLGRCSSGSKTL